MTLSAAVAFFPEIFHKVLYAAAITVGGILLFYLLFFGVKKWSKEEKRFFPTLIDKHLHAPGVMLFTLITLNIDFKLFKNYIVTSVYTNVNHLLHVLLIISVGYMLRKMVSFFYDVIVAIYSRKEYKDYTLRSVRTQYYLIARILNMLIMIITVIAVLLTFEYIRKFSTTILASAGMAGIVIGFAAQKSLGTIFAGIQIALTQSIKLDDIITIDNETGRVAELTLTYVVINTWDEKRLIIPINYFIDKSFKNWTRVSPEVIGEVKIHVDFTLPIESVREEFKEWLKHTKLWDKRSSSLSISETNETSMILRAKMSAKDSDDAGSLESYIREKLITLLQEKYPYALPAGHIEELKKRKSEKHAASHS
ncbi:MAG: rane protein [Bacteroidota bacterium]|nr:rane protein [Bacteroidota bacterium]